MSAQQPPSTLLPALLTKEIQDIYIRQNFQALKDYFQGQNQFYGFNFIEQVFTKAQTGIQVPHNLSFIPYDIVVTRISGSGSVTFQYSQFTSTNIVFDVSGPCWIRFYIGSYRNWLPAQNNASTDSQTFSAGSAASSTAVSSGFSRALYDYGSVPPAGANTYTIQTADDIISVNAATIAQTVVLPSATSFKNRALTILKSDTSANKVTINPANSTEFTAITLNVQNDRVILFSTGTVWITVSVQKAPTVQVFLTTGSVTYTPPAGTKVSRIRIVGGGGQGGGTGGSTGGTGGTSTFSTFITCTGGNPGGGSGTYGSGGGASCSSPAIPVVVLNGSGGGGSPTANNLPGSMGGCSPFGGAGGGGTQGGTGFGAIANSGSGGGGGSGNGSTGNGSGGGSGGYVEALLYNPLLIASSFSCQVATGGVGGAGGVGGSGRIIVEENY